MGFIWWAMPSLLTKRGIDLATVAALSSLLTLPWVFKFLMGPVIDYAVARGFQLRNFIMACQIMMGLLLLSLASIDWVNSYGLLTVMLFLHGCFAATQDVGIDALAIRTVPPDELGRINGWMQTGMLGGRALAAAAVVSLVSNGHQSLAVILVVALIWLPMLVLYVARPDDSQHFANEDSDLFRLLDWRKLITPLVLIGLWIALTAGAGFEFFTVSVGPLLQELGGTDKDISLLFGIAAPAGLAAGALAGGYYSASRNARQATFAGILLVGSSIILLTSLILRDISLTPTEWLLPILVVYLATGFLTASSYTLLMQISRGRFAATRFAVFMSATNGCEVWASYLGGRLTSSFGHAVTLLILLPASLLAAPALLILGRRQESATGVSSENS